MTEAELARIATDSRNGIAMRDWAIREAHGDGMSLRQIANAVGMSHSGVKRIVDSGANSVGAA